MFHTNPTRGLEEKVIHGVFKKWSHIRPHVFKMLTSRGHETIFNTIIIIMIDFFFRLVLFDVPVNKFSVTSEQVFLGRTSTRLGLMCLAPGHNAMTPLMDWCETSDNWVGSDKGLMLWL